MLCVLTLHLYPDNLLHRDLNPCSCLSRVFWFRDANPEPDFWLWLFIHNSLWWIIFSLSNIFQPHCLPLLIPSSYLHPARCMMKTTDPNLLAVLSFALESLSNIHDWYRSCYVSHIRRTYFIWMHGLLILILPTLFTGKLADVSRRAPWQRMP